MTLVPRKTDRPHLSRSHGRYWWCISADGRVGSGMSPRSAFNLWSMLVPGGNWRIYRDGPI